MTDFFEANLLLDGIILAALSVDNGKCDILGIFLLGLGFLGGALGSQKVN